jgi:hypothetical protein
MTPEEIERAVEIEDDRRSERYREYEPPKRTQGFYDGIDEAVYHADRESLSVSGAKILTDEGPAAFRWAQDHPRTSDAFDIGSAAHALVLGIGAPIVEVEASDWRTKAAQEARDEARANGCTPMLSKDYLAVHNMADKLARHETARRLLTEGRPEVSVYCPDERTGVMRRGRVDWLHPRLVVDYKTTAASVHPLALAGRYGTVRKWGYDRQAAWYLDLLRDLGHPAKAFAFIFQSKTEPYPVTVATVDEDDLWEARDKNADALSIFAACTETGIWPEPIPSNGWAHISLSHQTYIEESA